MGPVSLFVYLVATHMWVGLSLKIHMDYGRDANQQDLLSFLNLAF